MDRRSSKAKKFVPTKGIELIFEHNNVDISSNDWIISFNNIYMPTKIMTWLKNFKIHPKTQYFVDKIKGITQRNFG